MQQESHEKQALSGKVNERLIKQDEASSTKLIACPECLAPQHCMILCHSDVRLVQVQVIVLSG